MKLTPKQLRILQALAASTSPLTRKQMEPIAGQKGYSEALGAPSHGIRPGSLEALGFVARLNTSPPFVYQITDGGIDALRRTGYEVPTRARASSAFAASDIEEEFQANLKRSLMASSAERRKRLAMAPRFPGLVATTSFAFRRNSDVVAEVLAQADGKCQACRKSAPFNRKSDGTPYLEVHHRKPLAAGGEDTVENAIALCPNCHRAAHYA